MPLLDPTTEKPLPAVINHTPAQVEEQLSLSLDGFKAWRELAMEERGAFFQRLAEMLRNRAESYAALMAREMGKPLSAGKAEIEKCATACEYFADQAAAMLAVEAVSSDARRSYVRHDPLGPILAIMPWNYPFWQFFRFAAPALMAGNVAVLKHAPNVPGCADAIESLFAEAGFPVGVCVNVRIDNQAAERLIANPVIRAVTLTGSERAGRAVAAAAGHALKKTVLELGGSDAFLVFPDADLICVAAAAAAARCVNSGQSCIAAKRFIVHESVSAQFEFALAREMSALRMGDPTDPGTQLGPLAREDLLIHLHEQVEKTVTAGARLVAGGRRLPRAGWFYAPTVLGDVRPGMPAFDEETFGPVAAIIIAKSVDEMVHLANRSPYGLGASLWTSDTLVVEPLVARLDAGFVSINGAVKSDSRLPFGGVKNSGWGRELGSAGVREFTNAKTVWIA